MATSNRSASLSRQARPSQLPIAAVLSIVLFFAALVPRLSALNRYVTPDEPIWVYRSLRFREALLSFDWANTVQSGHPGVTTTWLGALAAQIQLWIQPDSVEHLDWIGKLYWLAPDNGSAIQHLAEFLTFPRLAVILLTSLGVVVIFLLARKRLGLLAAFLGSFFLAIDPFAAGLSGLLHVDALLAMFMLTAVLLTLPKKRNWDVNEDGYDIPPSNIHMVFAGAATGLAILTKVPALVLLILVPAMVFWPTSFSGSIWERVKRLIWWALTLIVTVLLLFPAIWAEPLDTLALISGLTGRLLESAVRPTFFLGEVTLEPGLGFYPIALVYRLSPVITLALLFVIGWILYHLIKKDFPKIPANVLWLLVYGLAFILFLNISAKRFDRYALPAIVAFIMVGGWGIAALAAGSGRERPRGLLGIFLIVLFCLVAIAYWLAYWPYPLTAYNWLMGGSEAAREVLPAGWGEGTSGGARWAAEKTGGGIPAENRTLLVTNVPAAAPFFPGRVMALNEDSLVHLQEEDAVLFSEQDWQFDPQSFVLNELSSAPQPKVFEQLAPALTLRFNGFPRATIFSGFDEESLSSTPITLNSRVFNFENSLAIVAAGGLATTWPKDQKFSIYWQAIQPDEYLLRLMLVDESNYSWVDVETPLLNDVDHGSRYWSVGETQIVEYSLPIPPDLPPGNYTVNASLFDVQGGQLGVFDDDGRFQGTVAPVIELTINPPATQPPINIPHALDYGNELSGYGTIPSQIGTGELLTLDLWWSPKEETPKEATLELSLGDKRLLANANLPTGRPGQIYHIRPTWRLPADLTEGVHPLSLQLVDAKGQGFWPEPVLIDQMEVVEYDRIFEIPNEISPLEVQFGSKANLQGLLAETTDDDVVIDLVWQALEPMDLSYTIFVHLRDENGRIVEQADRPSVKPTNIWVNEEVIVDQFIISRPSTGNFTIAVGLYDPASGMRLPVYLADGNPMPDDEYRIEIAIP